MRKSPVDESTTALDRESVNSCNNANPYRKLANRDIPVSLNSTCSVDNNTGKNTEEINGLIVNCDGDSITDFDNNISFIIFIFKFQRTTSIF